MSHHEYPGVDLIKYLYFAISLAIQTSIFNAAFISNELLNLPEIAFFLKNVSQILTDLIRINIDFFPNNFSKL